MATTRKYSRKREAILSVLRSTDQHPSAEWIYERLKPEFPDLSLGTVYRNLSVFRQEGEIASVATVAGQERFDGVVRPHAHFICADCGRVTDVDVPIPPALLSLDRRTAGGEVRGVSLTFHGICDSCRK